MASPRSTAPPTVEPEAGGARTRRRIVELAARRFGDVGYRDASVAAVARDVGITPAAVYPYFRTKRELFLAAAEHEIGALVDEARAATAGQPLPWLTLLQHVVDHVDAHPLIVRLLDGDPPELLPEVLDLPPLRATFEEFRDQLVEAQRAGVVRADIDARSLALGIETVALAMLGGVVRRATGQRAERRVAVGALLAAALLPAVERAPAAAPGRRPRRAGT